MNERGDSATAMKHTCIPDRILRFASRMVLIGLVLGSVMWFICKTSMLSYHNDAITLLCWEPGLSLYWGDDPEWRSMHAATVEPWPRLDEDDPFAFSGGTPADGFEFENDLIECGLGRVLNPRYWSVDRLGFGWPHARIASNGGYFVLPLGWFPALLVIALTVKLIRKYRRRPEYPTCPKCNYNLTGLTSVRCPECGEPVNRVRSARGTKSSPSAKV